VTPYVGEDPERTLRTRQRRAARIERFKQHQQRVHEWINFGDIAEWCAREEQSIVPNEEKRTAAYAALAKDLLAGEFDGKYGHTTVLYLHEQTARARMTRQWLQDAITHNYDGASRRQQYLPYCGYHGSCLSAGASSIGCRLRLTFGHTKPPWLQLRRKASVSRMLTPKNRAPSPASD
jgi:hypothetical protein